MFSQGRSVRYGDFSYGCSFVSDSDPIDVGGRVRAPSLQVGGPFRSGRRRPRCFPVQPSDKAAVPARVKVLYIIGTQRGGSTIVGRVLGLLPDMEFAGEVRRLWGHGMAPGRTCGCGRLLPDCPVWSNVLEAVAAAGIDPDEVPELQRQVAPVRRSWRFMGRLLAAKDELGGPRARYIEAMGHTYAALADVYGAAVLVDGSKLPGDAAVLAGISSVDAYYLHLVRDPRGVLASQLRRRHPTSSVRRLCGVVAGLAMWALRHDTPRRLRAAVGDARILRIRYEDFVADPSAAAAAVSVFLGHGPAPLPAGPMELPLVHTPAGPLGARTVELEEDTRWRRELSVVERGLVTALAAPWLLRYRYLVRSSAA